MLNGPSSAGKSTLARAVRDRLGPTATAVSVDRLFAFMHPEAPNKLAALNVAVFATAISFANNGFDVIVDTVFERPEALRAARRVLNAQTYFLVAVTCRLEVLEAREKARGNRRIGLAREQYEQVWHGATYELQLDTSLLSSEACVDRIVALLEMR